MKKQTHRGLILCLTIKRKLESSEKQNTASRMPTLTSEKDISRHFPKGWPVETSERPEAELGEVQGQGQAWQRDSASPSSARGIALCGCSFQPKFLHGEEACIPKWSSLLSASGQWVLPQVSPVHYSSLTFPNT